MTAAKRVKVLPADGNDEIRYLPIADLEPSPFNPRKTLDAAEVAELAESIREHGILVPLLVREVPIGTDLVRYEIIAGSRRCAAANIAHEVDAPCIVRRMTDDEARELAIVDNLQRKDMPPLEEAQAFNEAMILAQDRIRTVQELAARVGKSPVYISRRLTLLDASLGVQSALRKGLIEVGHALELARLSESDQDRLLQWLDIGFTGPIAKDDEEDFFDGDTGNEVAEPLSLDVAQTRKSLQELRSYISRTTLRILAEAPFDPHDSALVEEAGSCLTCLKRSGANQLLFSDVRGEDVCTDRACFDGKVKALVARKFTEAKAEKKQLHQITGEWSKKGPQVHYLGNGIKEVGAKRCGFLVEAIHVDGRSIGKVIEICVGAECKIHGSRGFSSGRSVPSEKEKADRKALLAKVKAEKDYRLRLFKELIAKPLPDAPTGDMIRALVMFAFTRVDSTKNERFAEALAWPKDIFSWRGDKARMAQLMPLTPADAIRIALVGLEANELTVHEHDVQGKGIEIGLEKVAKLIGVDHVALRSSIGKPPAAKPAAKKTAAKKAAEKPAKSAPAKKAAAKPAKKAAKKAPTKKAAKPAKKAVRR